MVRIERSSIVALIATFCVVMLLISHTEANPLDTSTEAFSDLTTQVITTTTPKACPYNGACGWGVYGENKKKIKYFIRNTCTCPPEFGCLLDDDDLSLSAFVYSCKERKAST